MRRRIPHIRITLIAIVACACVVAPVAWARTERAVHKQMPRKVRIPEIHGRTVALRTLRATRGTWRHHPTSFHFRWRRCRSRHSSCVAITGATRARYTLKRSDAGYRFIVYVTARNHSGSRTVRSRRSAVVLPAGAAGGSSTPAGTPATITGMSAAQPVVSGDLEDGQTLSSTSGSWTDNPSSYGYQWEHCDLQGVNCSIITGAAGSTYTIRESDVGYSLRSIVTATAAAGVQSIYSGATGLATGACTTTFTPSTIGNSPYNGSAMQSDISKGAGGPVYCLASGSYPAITLYSDSPSTAVTIEPAPGASATNVAFNLNGVSNVTMQNFGGSNAASSSGGFVTQDVSGNNTNLNFLDNDMNSSGVDLKNAATNANIYIARNQFVGFGSSGEQSRMLVNTANCSNGVTIAHNLFSGGDADGIDVDGGSCGTVITGNTISNIVESHCGSIHCDAFQDNGGGEDTTIEDNYISGSSDCWLMDDGSSGYSIENNVCTATNDSSYWMQFGGAADITFEHNTVVSTNGAEYGNNHGGTPSSNVTLLNNIWYSVPKLNSGQPVSGSNTENYNMGPSGGGSGAHDKRATPSFAGGTAPSAWTGFALGTTSPGYDAGSDGQSEGVEAGYFAIGTSQPSGTLPGPTG